MDRFIGKAVVKALISLATVIGSVGSAQAATYKGSWDPLFSPPFSNLWWRGSATFDTGPCVSDGLHANTGPCAGMVVSDVVIEFSNALNGPTLQTLNFQSVFGAYPASQINGMKIAGGQLVGVFTEYYVTGIQGAITESLLSGPSQQPFFSVAFIGGQAFLGYKREAAYSFSCTSNTSPLIPPGDCGSQAADIVFTPVTVPEPGTYALLLAGLAAVGWVNRRRRA